MANKNLFTTAEVKEERKRLYELQSRIDPILQKVVEFNDTVCDHDHVSQNTRAALHRQVNAFEGKITNAYIRYLKWLTDKPLPEILRNLADYLEQDYSTNPYHPGWIKRVTTDFRKLKAKEQLDVLAELGYNAVKPNDRVVTFQKAIKSKKFSFEQIKGFINEVKE